MKEQILHRIRMARHELGYSQQNVADELGLKRSTYSKIERGEIEMKMDRLDEIARILKKDVADLVGLPNRHLAAGESPMAYGTLTHQVSLLASQLSTVQHKLGQLENDVRRLESKI